MLPVLHRHLQHRRRVGVAVCVEERVDQPEVMMVRLDEHHVDLQLLPGETPEDTRFVAFDVDREKINRLPVELKTSELLLYAHAL